MPLISSFSRLPEIAFVIAALAVVTPYFAAAADTLLRHAMPLRYCRHDITAIA